MSPVNREADKSANAQGAVMHPRTKVVRINGRMFYVTVDPITTATSNHPRYRIHPVGVSLTGSGPVGNTDNGSNNGELTFYNADDALDYMSDYGNKVQDKLAVDMVSPLH